MLATNRFARIFACVAAMGMMISPAFGARPTSPSAKPKVFDVRLAEGGRLIGQVANAAGKPQAGVRVLVASKRIAQVAETRADEVGRFSMVLPESGVYRITVSDRAFTIRAWQADLAPPTSKLGLLCVTDDVVRGNHHHHHRRSWLAKHPRLCSFLTNPVVIGLGIATAIALPVSLDDDDVPAGAGAVMGEGEPAS